MLGLGFVRVRVRVRVTNPSPSPSPCLALQDAPAMHRGAPLLVRRRTVARTDPYTKLVRVRVRFRVRVR